MLGRKMWSPNPLRFVLDAFSNALNLKRVNQKAFSKIVMTPPPQICSNHRCHHKGHPLSLDYFHKDDSPPDCYIYHLRCSDCRKTSQIPLPPHLSGPSPAKAPRKHCSKCHRLWSLPRFPNQYQKDEHCIFCRIT